MFLYGASFKGASVFKVYYILLCKYWAAAKGSTGILKKGVDSGSPLQAPLKGSFGLLRHRFGYFSKVGSLFGSFL